MALGRCTSRVSEIWIFRVGGGEVLNAVRDVLGMIAWIVLAYLYPRYNEPTIV